jgi:hypothetical protein
LDYTGTRREARNFESQFFREIGEAIIAQVHPSHREPSRSEVVSAWRLAGYRLASHLLPGRHKRFPEELNAFIIGLRQRMAEYESEQLGPLGVEVEEAFDVEACEKLEARAHKFLKLATHAGTPLQEAQAAAMGLAKMILGSELAVIGWARAAHFTQEFEKMKSAFALFEKENPLQFLYGTRDQNH